MIQFEEGIQQRGQSPLFRMTWRLLTPLSCQLNDNQIKYQRELTMDEHFKTYSLNFKIIDLMQLFNIIQIIDSYIKNEDISFFNLRRKAKKHKQILLLKEISHKISLAIACSKHTSDKYTNIIFFNVEIDLIKFTLNIYKTTLPTQEILLEAIPREEILRIKLTIETIYNLINEEEKQQIIEKKEEKFNPKENESLLEGRKSWIKDEVIKIKNEETVTKQKKERTERLTRYEIRKGRNK